MPQELLDARLFVRLWFFGRKKLKMLPNGHFEGNSKTIFDSLYLDYEDDFRLSCKDCKGFDEKTGKEKKWPKVHDKTMERAWNEFLEEAQLLAKQEIIDAIKFTNGDSVVVEVWLRSVMGVYEPMHLEAFKHFLWTVKRKAFNLPVVYTISPAFWGKQGGGKTIAIKHLTSPLKDLTIEWSIDQALDTRNTQTLADNLIVIFDEMAGLQRVEVESLKRVISADFSSYRPLHTNRQLKVKQNCGFIGVSNKSLSENIFDSTGLRRFVEYKCLDKLDWKSLDILDPLKLWQSIDESKERGYLEPVMKEIGEHQENMVQQDELSAFIQETELLDSGEMTEMTATALWNHYDTWHANSGWRGNKALILTVFAARMRTHGVTFKKRHNKAYYLVNKSAKFFNEVPPMIVKNLEFKKEQT